MFETDFEKIFGCIEAVDPVRYGRTRNFLDGAVTRLSPYISRGVISTRDVFESVAARTRHFPEIEKFLMELAWRDYFQRLWTTENIDEDLKQPQPDVANNSMPKAVLEAATGIEAIDRGIRGLYETGYVHNHVRMYIASVVCNVAKSHWRVPARWFYYHLLDADWASNALSWQWTAAAFSSKKYFANQENINKYCGTTQRDTFLDVAYDEFEEIDTPDVLTALETPAFVTELPAKSPVEVDESRPTLVYNFYNLDPRWREGETTNRILLLEPSHFERYPVSPKTLEFLMKLTLNIKRIQIYVGEFDEFAAEFPTTAIIYKEHPTARHYRGTMDERDWLVPGVKGFYPTFFSYWKKIEKPLKQMLRDRSRGLFNNL